MKKNVAFLVLAASIALTTLYTVVGEHAYGQTKVAERAAHSDIAASSPIQKNAAPIEDPKEQRDIDDLRAQQEMAQWALGMLVCTAIGLLISGVSVLLIFRTMAASIEAASAARDQVVVSREAARAHIFVRPISMRSEPFSFNGVPTDLFAQRVSWQLEIVNHGQSVAILISVLTEAINPTPPEGLIVPTGQNVSFTESVARDYLHPSKNKVVDIEYCFHHNQWPESLTLQGLVKYEDVFGKAHETHFSIHVVELPEMTDELFQATYRIDDAYANRRT